MRGVIKLKGQLPEKSLPFSEEEFRTKIRESVNRLEMKERNKSDKIFYTQLSKSRRYEKLKDKPKNMMSNCRTYLELMERYILDSIQEHNQNLSKKHQADTNEPIEEDVLLEGEHSQDSEREELQESSPSKGPSPSVRGTRL